MASESRQEKGSSSGYCYSSDISSSSAHHQQHLVNQMQSFESNPELFNLTTGMEMLTFPSKNRDMDGGGSNNHHNHNNNNHNNNNNNNNSVMWKGFYETSSGNHLHHEFNKSDFSSASTGLISESTSDQNLIESSWQDHTTTNTTTNNNNNNNNSNRLMVDDSSLRCVFPCEGTERPSQGLSLSLSSNKPSTIGLQSFELRDSNQQDGFFGKSTNFHPHQQQQLLQQQHQMFQSSSSSSLLHLKNSKYLPPTQELLDELCNLGTKTLQKQIKPHKINHLDDENGSSGSSRKNPFLYSLDLLELQKRKSKLLSMLEEVDRRYRQYCDQMRGVVSTFESVVGMGSASVYSTLASKAMSKHFRCLRDGIVDEIKATKKAMGEKEVPIAPGTTKGETPRLRVLDQTLRQQRAFQQMSMLDSHPWRPQRGLPERSVSVLRAWLFEHFLHPYPSDVDKHILARQTGLSRSQVSNWFINARVRLWKPMVEEMYLEETKEQENIAAAASASASSSDWITNLDENTRAAQDHHQLYSRLEDHKPTPDQLIHGDSDHQSLSSIINIPSTHRIDTENTRNHHHHNQFQLHQETNHHHDHGFGVVNMDFSAGAYNNGAVMNHHLMGNGVSLTLGLQQHGSTGGSGMRSLSFNSPVTVAAASQHQHSLYYPRDDDHHHQMEDCVQYSSILDGEAAAAVHENLPYRNLMGGAHQLLHDLA